MTSRKITHVIILFSIGYSVLFISMALLLYAFPGLHPNMPTNIRRLFSLIAFFFFLILAGITISTYYFPAIQKKIHRKDISSNASPYEVVLFISTPEEVKVIQAIKALFPQAYKFEIARETGLSRMKVHRIVLRLAERGIVKIDNKWRYSRVYLLDWLNQSNSED